MSMGFPFASIPVQCVTRSPQPTSVISRVDLRGAASQNLDLERLSSHLPWVRSLAFGGAAATACALARHRVAASAPTRDTLTGSTFMFMQVLVQWGDKR